MGDRQPPSDAELKKDDGARLFARLANMETLRREVMVAIGSLIR